MSVVMLNMALVTDDIKADEALGLEDGVEMLLTAKEQVV